MKEFKSLKEEYLQEGVYDPGIFKAYFLAGGPGSGKTFVTASAFGGTGLKVINSDAAFENALKKNILSFKMPDDETEVRDMLRARAKATTGKVLDLAIMGRLGMVVDGTGRDFDKIKYQASLLQQLGYDCYMVFVNTTLDVALMRNKGRERTIPEYITKKSWQKVQLNMGAFQRVFGPSKMLIVDNSRDEKELVTKTLSTASKFIRSRLRTKPENRTAMAWIKRELELKKRI